MSTAVLLSLRLVTIGLRFALTIITTSMLGLSAMGMLALAIGAAGLVPSLVGGGLNYHLAREAVGETPASYAPVIRDRFVATVIGLVGFFAVALPVYQLTVAPVGVQQVLVVLIAVAETIAMEQYMVLVGLRRAQFANVLVFVRSAAWIPFIPLLFLLVPDTRRVETIFLLWIAGHLVAAAVFLAAAFKWQMIRAWRSAPPTGWVRRTLPKSWFIYMSDLGLAGVSFGDRFLISALLGLQAAGAFGFYWSYANALQTLVVTSVIQPALPDLLEQHRHSRLEWGTMVMARWRRLLIACLVGAVGLGAGVLAMVALAPSGRFPWAPAFAILLIFAIAVRTASEYLSTALSSAGRHHGYAIANLAGVGAMVLTVVTLAPIGGLVGAAAALTITALLTTGVRAALIIRERGNA